MLTSRSDTDADLSCETCKVRSQATQSVERSLLDGVLPVVRRFGRNTSLREALDLILDGIVAAVGFGAAAITPDGGLRIDRRWPKSARPRPCAGCGRPRRFTGTPAPDRRLR